MKSQAKINKIVELAKKIYGESKVSVEICENKNELREDIFSITTINIKGLGRDYNKGIYLSLAQYSNDVNIGIEITDFNDSNFREDRFKRIYFSHYSNPSYKYLKQIVENLDFIFSLAMNLKKMDEYEKKNY